MDAATICNARHRRRYEAAWLALFRLGLASFRKRDRYGLLRWHRWMLLQFGLDILRNIQRSVISKVETLLFSYNTIDYHLTTVYMFTNCFSS